MWLMDTAATPVASARGAVDARAAVSDERLMARVRSGDEEAFGWIYDRYAGSLLAFCHHTLGSREEAEDALQHVFVAAHKQMRSGSPPQQLKPWLYAVARNRCLSVLRARRETVALDDVLEPAAVADVSREAERREDVRELLADVAALPYEQREALILAEVGALSHEEIAVTLGVRKDKVKALVFQARRSLMVSREARETTCRDIQERLAVERGGALRRGAIRRHVDRCPACAAFKGEVQRQRSLLAAALPVLPAAALKPTILAAAHAGATGAGAGAGAAAAGGISAVAAATGSPTAVGGGLAGLGSSALLTKALAVGAVAGIAVGGATAVVRLQHRTVHPAATAPPAARATSMTPATAKAASISALSVTAAPAGQPASESGGGVEHGQGRAPIRRRDPGQRGGGVVKGQAVESPDGTAESISSGSLEGSKAPEAEPGASGSATPGSFQPGLSAGESTGVRPGSSAGVSGSVGSGSSAGESGSAGSGSSAGESSSAGAGSSTGESSSAAAGVVGGEVQRCEARFTAAAQSNSAKPDSPPGQSNSAKPDSPPGQSNSAKPDSPGKSGDANPESSAGESNSATPGPSAAESNGAKPDSPPGQSNSAKPDSPGKSDDAKPGSSAGKSNSAKPDS